MENREPTATPSPGGAGSDPQGGVTEQDFSPEAWVALQTKAAKAEENWNALLRTTADFDNFKKRAARERQDALKYATEGLLEKLVPVMDNFEMALLAANQATNSSADSLRTGVNMIYQQLRSVLMDAGLAEVNAQGQPFDPNIHEAVSQQESAEIPEGHVLQQLRKGYRLRERLLRPATVIVSKSPASS